VVTGKASQQILALADDRLADLIVMGVAGHTPFARAVMGSTTHRVVRDARCPVLTVPA
jgi:nucleotide-binding universal stress UspA family protein